MTGWNKTPRQAIGERIEVLRSKKGLTQAELANAMTAILGKNISRETVKQWELGDRDLKTEATVALAEFFDTNCDYILRGINSQNTDINSALGLSDASINILRALNYLPTLHELAQPGLDRLLSSKDIFEFLGNLTAAFTAQDTAPSEALLETIYGAINTSEFTEEEQQRLASYCEDSRKAINQKDLYEYKAQKTLVSIIRGVKQEAE